MMKCQRCGSKRVLSAGGKCSDLFSASIDSLEVDGYVPDDLGIGGGNYIEFDLCLDCGQLQGNFPLPTSLLEKEVCASELFDFFEESFNEGELFSNIYASRRDRMVKDSAHLSYRLSKWLKDMLDCHCDITSESKVPDMTTLISMYKRGSFEL